MNTKLLFFIFMGYLEQQLMYYGNGFIEPFIVLKMWISVLVFNWFGKTEACFETSIYLLTKFEITKYVPVWNLNLCQVPACQHWFNSYMYKSFHNLMSPLHSSLNCLSTFSDNINIDCCVSMFIATQNTPVYRKFNTFEI